MKLKLLALLLLFGINYSFAQLITTDPVFPVEEETLKVTFNATAGNGGLEGYTGDVYAHTGVITNKSSGPSDWKYVKTNWGQNTAETKLTRLAADLYQFSTGVKSIREFYNVPANEEILQVAFVFRSAAEVGGSYLEGKTETGGDIFVDVYSSGLFVKFTNPLEYGNLMQPGSNLLINAAASQADSMILLINNVRVSSTPDNSISYAHTIPSTGKHYMKIRAYYNGQQVEDSAYYYVLSGTPQLPLPAGMRDGINYLNDSTAVLVLYAPGKQNCFVLGDFNNWEYSDEGFMNYQNGRFWKQITGLVPQKEYVYQYKVDAEIVVADPYAEKILDPWNDKFIPAVTYPDLIEYPQNKASSYASVLQTAQADYNWIVPEFQRPEKNDLVIYELLVRDFIARHDYQTLMDTLSYLKRLGINAVELMPVYEFEGNSSWGYNTAFHFAPDKYYGTKDDLKAFIDLCHQNGIAVIMDMVLNHVFGASPFARLYWDAANNRPAANNPWLNPVAKHDFNVGYDFNHESQATKDLVTRVVKFWIEEYNIDGYRFDLSKGFTQKNTLGNTSAWGQYDASRVAIWKGIADKIWTTDDKAYVILEHFADNSEEKVLANYGMMLWGNHNHAYRQLAMGWSENSDISSISYKVRGWNNPHLVGYMESHDEERMMYSINEWGNTGNAEYPIKNIDVAINRLAAAAAIFYTIPGPKMLWQFGELAYDYSIDYNGRVGEKPIKWDYADNWARKALYNVTAALIKLKQEYDVFETSDFTLSSGSGLTKTLILRSNEMSVSVLANFDIVEKEITANFNSTGFWYDYFAGDSINVTAVNQKITLQPGEFRLYSSKKLTKPETGLSIPEKAQYNNIMLKNVFPNPAKDYINVQVDPGRPGHVTMELIDVLGRKSLLLFDGKLDNGDNVLSFKLDSIPGGMYILKMATSYRTETLKVYKEQVTP